METIDLISSARSADVLIMPYGDGERVAGHDVSFSKLAGGWYFVRPDTLTVPPVLTENTKLVWRGVELNPVAAMHCWKNDIQTGHGDLIVLVNNGQLVDMLDADSLHDAVLAYHDAVTQ